MTFQSTGYFIEVMFTIKLLDVKIYAWEMNNILSEKLQGRIAIITGEASGSCPKFPMRRLSGIENDIGRMAVIFLASEDSAYRTGQAIMVDGGATKLR